MKEEGREGGKVDEEEEEARDKGREGRCGLLDALSYWVDLSTVLVCNHSALGVRE